MSQFPLLYLRERAPRWTLQFAALLYRALVYLRNRLYDLGALRAKHSSLAVICVGNIIAGGSGKTPFVRYLVQGLRARGFKPVILLRGYGGRIRRPHLLTTDNTALEVGDEALLHYGQHHAEVPVVIAARRAAGAEFIEQNNLGNVIVLDDGLQHRALARDIDFLLLDTSTPESTNAWQQGHLLPLGLQREPLSAALKRCSFVVFTARGLPGDYQQLEQQHFTNGLPQARFLITPGFLRELSSGEQLRLDYLQGKRVLAVTAIANPDGFLNMLRRLGAEVAQESQTFPDHYQYTAADWRTFSQTSLPIITTAKDAVKLQHFITAQTQVLVLEIVGKIDKAEEENSLWRLIDDVGRKI